MADLNKQSLKRVLVPGGTWGRNTKVSGVYEADGAQVDDVIHLIFIPAGTRVDDLRFINAELGASSEVRVGYKNADETVDDYWLGNQNTATAGSARTEAFSRHFTKDSYVIATVKGAAATGKIEAIVDYEYIGK